MKSPQLLKSSVVLALAGACVCMLAACSNITGIAATVNGVDIMEEDVTQLVTTLRAQQQVTETDQWGLYLAATQQTPSSVRDSYIGLLRDRELAQEGAKELGIELDTTEVDLQIQTLKANFGSDAAWKKSLSDSGWTENEYRTYVAWNVLTQQLQDYFEQNVEVDDEAMVEAAQLYASYLYDGRKQSSHILFQVEDTSDQEAMAEAREKAQGVLDQINADTLSFEDAVAQYSDDTASARQGGDVGYATDKLVTEYLEGLSNLEVGQVSDLVESEFGIHIIKCTGEYEAPEEITSMDQIPEAFHEGIREAARRMQIQNAYSDWLTGLRDAATFTQNNMPSGLPYDLDIEKYEKRYAELTAQIEAAQGESSDDADDADDADDEDGERSPR